MDSQFIELWWQREYQKFSIRDQTKALFFKFNQIRGSYNAKQENNIEYFKEDSGLKTLFWEDEVKLKGEEITSLTTSVNFTYRSWGRRQQAQDSKEKIKVNESSKCDEFIESGEIEYFYPSYTNKIEWKKIIGPPDQGLDLPLYEIRFEGRRDSPKGQVVFSEHIISDSNTSTKTCNYKRSSVEVTEFVSRKGQKITKKITKKADNLLKVIETVSEGVNNSQKVSRIRRNESLITTTEKSGDAYYFESSADALGRLFGKVSLKEPTRNYEAKWLILESKLLASIDVSYSQASIHKTWKLDSSGVFEITDFKLSGSRWGIIKDSGRFSSFLVEWKDNKPDIYKPIWKKMTDDMSKPALKEGSFKIDRATSINEIKAEAMFLFENIIELNTNKSLLFHEDNTRLFELKHRREQKEIEENKEKVIQAVKLNNKYAERLLKGQSNVDFEKIVGDALDKRKIFKEMKEYLVAFKDFNHSSYS